MVVGFADFPTVVIEKDDGSMIGCYICEEPYSRRLMQRRCTGKGHGRPAPLLPGGRHG